VSHNPELVDPGTAQQAVATAGHLAEYFGLEGTMDPGLLEIAARLNRSNTEEEAAAQQQPPDPFETTSPAVRAARARECFRFERAWRSGWHGRR
jgi:hypothetical protein